ncbi:MAG: UPF0182 family protein [Actinomycetota bacterium]
MKIPGSGSRPRVSRRSLIVSIAGLVVFLILLGSGATFYTDLLWFEETGFKDVFTTQIWTKAMLGLAFGAIFAVVLLVNLFVVQKLTSPSRLFTMQDQVLERYRATLRPYVRWGVVGISLLFGLFAGSGATAQWRNWLLFSHSEKFGTVDPLFHKDIGFYIFKLPFHRFLFTWGFSSLLVITIVVGVAHYFMGGIRSGPVGERVTPQVKAHLSVLLGVLVLLKAWGYRLDQFSLLFSKRGTINGASYTDVHAQWPALKLMVIIAIVAGILFLINIRLRGWIMPAAAVGILALTSILAGGLYPALVQRFSVNPQERVKETPFIERNIEQTRAAFGIDDKNITVKTFTAAQQLNAQAIQRNRSTVENIRLWSPDVLNDVYTQVQRITPYYEFFDVDIDRYNVGGTRRQVMLSAREIFQSGLPSSARTWLNNHLVYTHGFEVVASRVDRVTSDGQPSFLLSDIPGQTASGFPKVDQPRIYFGETEDVPFVLVNTAEDEVDYPTGEKLQTTKYSGDGGIQMKGFFRRAAFAWRFRDFNVLISGAVNKDSRIIFRRRISDRLRMAAPFLKFDHDPYIAIVDGRLTWINDAYTTTDMYPYSQRLDLGQIIGTDSRISGTANYIRNSVKATVDALTGKITLYVVDESDPVIRAWRRIWPAIFKPATAVSTDLRSHFRYPEDLFTVQAAQYTLYHIKTASDFYQREDAWRIPNDPRPREADDTFPPYYVLMRLPGEQEQQFILMLPFAPFSQQGSGTRRTNMTAWLAARSDPNGYGEMLSFVFPRSQNIPGPEQIQARINQDPAVSQQITLWNQSNSIVRYGNLLVIPIENSLLYVQPLYLEASERALPELKRVVAVSGENIVMGESLDKALAALFGQGAEAPIEGPGTVQPPPTGASEDELIAEALQHLQRANDALRRGDLATYQREVDAAQDALERANRASPTPTPR